MRAPGVSNWLLLLCFILTGLVLALDLALPLGVAAAVPYLVVVLLTWWLPGVRYTLAFTLLCTVLTLCGFLLSPEGGDLWKIVMNRGMALFAIWTTALLLWKRKQQEEKLRHFGEAIARHNTDLDAANKALTATNAELELYTAAMSHDLQSPLLTMRGYAQLLQSRYQDRLDPKADRYLSFIVGAAGRMSALIKDFLALSRAAHQEIRPKPVAVASVLATVLADLQAEIRDSGAVITQDTFPTVRADASLLGLLFQNLISNAIKFRDTAGPRIHVSVTQQEGRWCFSIRDNGIGIETQYLESIFEGFKCLHGPEKYEGTGLGLAICQKVVERHDGRIWVESTIGEGSVFYFTLQ